MELKNNGTWWNGSYSTQPILISDSSLETLESNSISETFELLVKTSVKYVTVGKNSTSNNYLEGILMQLIHNW